MPAYQETLSQKRRYIPRPTSYHIYEALWKIGDRYLAWYFAKQPLNRRWRAREIVTIMADHNHAKNVRMQVLHLLGYRKKKDAILTTLKKEGLLP